MTDDKQKVRDSIMLEFLKEWISRYDELSHLDRLLLTIIYQMMGRIIPEVLKDEGIRKYMGEKYYNMHSSVAIAVTKLREIADHLECLFVKEESDRTNEEIH